MDPTTDAHIANSVSSNITDLSPTTERVVRDTIANGTATYRSHYELNLHDEYVVRSGEPTYYRVTVTAGDHVEATGYHYEVGFGDDVQSPSDTDQVVNFADLPRPDRESFLIALGPKAKLRKAEGAHFAVTFAYADKSTRERSLFVPETDIDYVRWQGKDIQITFDEERSVSIVTYAITAERVANSTAAFVDQIRDEQGTVLDDLPTDQQDIIEKAMDGGYSACEPYSDAFQQLLDRLSSGEDDFASLVRYDGTWYFAHVSQWVE